MNLGFYFTHRNDSEQKGKEMVAKKKSGGTLRLPGSTVKIRYSVHIQQAQTRNWPLSSVERVTK